MEMEAIIVIPAVLYAMKGKQSGLGITWDQKNVEKTNVWMFWMFYGCFMAGPI
jgi:hypothetical protein